MAKMFHDFELGCVPPNQLTGIVSLIKLRFAKALPRRHPGRELAFCRGFPPELCLLLCPCMFRIRVDVCFSPPFWEMCGCLAEWFMENLTLVITPPTSRTMSRFCIMLPHMSVTFAKGHGWSLETGMLYRIVCLFFPCWPMRGLETSKMLPWSAGAAQYRTRANNGRGKISCTCPLSFRSCYLQLMCVMMSGQTIQCWLVRFMPLAVLLLCGCGPCLTNFHGQISLP